MPLPSPIVIGVETMVRGEFKKSEPRQTVADLTADDRAILERECKQNSAFDELNARHEMFEHVITKGNTRPAIRQSREGKIIALLQEEEQAAQIPWNLWFRILRLFYRDNPYRIFLCAHPHRRMFPPKNRKITPLNINGGYTYPCDNSCIVIYRAEDATRVLIHELLHASCTDNTTLGVDLIEAETEAWAELLYVGLLSRGIHAVFVRLIREQSTLMRMQNEYIRRNYIGRDSMEFPWRYTIGKEAVWHRWGILYNGTLPRTNPTSLRLTITPTEEQKRENNVSIDKSSTIL